MLRTALVRGARSQRIAHGLRGFASTGSTCVDKERLVILGSGWGGYEVLRKVDKSRYDVTVVSPTSHFAFTPLLAGAAVGTIEYDCAIEPVRKYTDIRYYQAWADAIDLVQRRVTCMPAVGVAATSDEPRKLPGTGQSFELGFDKLVIAVGAYSQTFGTEGVKEYATFLKETKDARKIRARILECFELAAQPTLTDVDRRNVLHFVIVGGGPTGVEFAGELSDFLTSDLARAFPTLAPLAKITIYDVAPGILGSFDASLQRYAEDKFARDGIDVQGNRHVVRVERDHLVVEEVGKVPYGLLVWSTGLAPNPLVEALGDLAHDTKTHALKVTDGLNAIRTSDGGVERDVFVVGDASALEAKLPATAQVASQEALFVAKHLNSLAKGQTTEGDKKFEFNNQGSLAYLGGWSAIMDRTSATKGPKGEVSGRAAWLLWRSAYWSQAMSVRNKVLLAFYWFVTWLGGRRITRV
ncbi:hypothetical protein JCM11491_000426 [Sporobolomyces phaffii]